MKKRSTLLRSPGRCGIYMAILFSLLYVSVYSQCLTSLEYYEKINGLGKKGLSNQEQLTEIAVIQKNYNACRLPADSVYAFMLHRIGVLKSATGRIIDAISSTKQSVLINMNGKRTSSRYRAAFSYYNLGAFYMDQHFFTEALSYFEQCIALSKGSHHLSIIDRACKARYSKAYMYHQIGDNQKDIYETTLALKSAVLLADTSLIVSILHERAQAYTSLQMIDRAVTDLDRADSLTGKNTEALSNNLKLRALTSEANNDLLLASNYYKKAIEIRKKNHNKISLAMDYLDAGNFLRATSTRYIETRTYYKQALRLALDTNNHDLAAKALNNLGTISFRTKNYSNALQEYQRSLTEAVPSFVSTDPLQNPLFASFGEANKVFLYQLLSNKAESLLYLHKQTKKAAYLTACLQTALLTDSVITGMRHEQTEELSKLHWLKDARDVFTNALEACYMSGDAALAFYFMEKSRSVLLNDRLNELGANATLPPADAEKERNYLINVIAEKQQLSKLGQADPKYSEQETRYLEAKENFESFTKTLQHKYPAYYQYKYADDVPSFHAFQQQLKAGQQCFIHYFVSDTCLYILATTPVGVKMIRQPVASSSMLHEFMNLCSDKQALNRNDGTFTALSHQLYRILFEPLKLPFKRVVICNDNFLLPFDALTADAAGKDFLINRYAFSYAYSARSLMKKFDNPSSDGDCLLVAPASFGNPGMSTLDESEKLLEESSDFYNDSRILLGRKANKRDFLKQIPHYKIVNIYSHATAGSSGAEPLLYMQDDSIGLSELQTLSRPATQLVVLSACETSAGKNAAGEGIYSLARGFAAAGIPSVATTLWKADAKAMYLITKGFHQRLSQGMRTDEALQQAKLAYLRSSKEQPLPYFWANMVLAGNGEAIDLTKAPLVPDAPYQYWLLLVLAVLVVAISVVLYYYSPQVRLEVLA